MLVKCQIRQKYLHAAGSSSGRAGGQSSCMNCFPTEWGREDGPKIHSLTTFTHALCSGKGAEERRGIRNSPTNKIHSLTWLQDIGDDWTNGSVLQPTSRILKRNPSSAVFRVKWCPDPFHSFTAFTHQLHLPTTNWGTLRGRTRWRRCFTHSQQALTN